MQRTWTCWAGSGGKVRVQVVDAHPVETSFHAALRKRIAAALALRREVDLLDFIAEGFNPVIASRACEMAIQVGQNRARRSGMTAPKPVRNDGTDRDRAGPRSKAAIANTQPPQDQPLQEGRPT